MPAPSEGKEAEAEAEVVRSAFHAALAGLAAVPDPMVRVRAAGLLQDVVRDLQGELRAIRYQAVAALRETRTLQEIADELGVSVARVSQLSASVSHRQISTAARSRPSAARASRRAPAADDRDS
ncbi:sigma factor-like helix-turn-helix DNA-binding protein [Yinghuangia seranimata]|uniref:sigma factor-like helix-turn-helix DNA-binding protein n=1 Tax=Yinghuangia seranimata TaxID=408067 RepID=UPI00248AB1DF|nr:sigma factor-like helix-turn-helix DNA-binding protein [Yinghuangia seranimata]